MEAAMKLARQYFLELSPPEPERFRFIAREGSFHGTTAATLALTGRQAVRRQFAPLLKDNVTHVSACNPYRGLRAGETIETYVQRLATELDDEFQRVGPKTVCAFVAETVAGTALGCIPPSPGYFVAMKAVCDKYGALLILDEVICGMGRTGTAHAWQQEGVVPDIQAVAKGLGGGYTPIAALISGYKVVQAIDGGTGFFNHGHTYQSHAVACAAAVEVQNIIQQNDLIVHVANMGKRLEKGLRAALQTHPHVGDIRGRGLLWAIEFVKNKDTKEPFSPQEGISMKIRNIGLVEPFNISLWPVSGGATDSGGDHIMISPAYNISEEDIDFIVSSTSEIVKLVFAGK
ncbi:hypothetical protein G7Y89_g3397 [Cudoniella acicularis]|uniref:Aminotransferase n=1 Tax=Cudoniella acicularis TaxID=354080 RepID=A0A8H4RRG6_9HELO|nr:hypothetical protein G7Y89_g3397 [Cudoniella acicularis]